MTGTLWAPPPNMGGIARTFAILLLLFLLGKTIMVIVVLSARNHEPVALVSDLPQLVGTGDVFQLVDKKAVKVLLQPWRVCQHK